MPEENDKSKIDRLSEKLYSRSRYKPPEDLREPITPREGEEAPQAWDSPELNTLLESDRRQPEPYPLIKKVFYVALVFFICALGAAALIYFKGDNFISTKNLDITVEAPVSVAAGSPVPVHITITNKNNAPIEKVSMHIIYPDGTRSAADGATIITSADESIDALDPGAKITKDENVIFLGTEGEQKSVHISVSYRVTGSNAIFSKDKVFDITIGNAPVSVSVTRPATVVSGENFSTTISVSANSEQALHNVVLQAEYPYGWNFSDASPPSIDGSHTEWLLGDLSPGDRKTITLNGSLTGEDNDERTFRFLLGVGKAGSTALDTTLATDDFVISIEHPGISLSVKLNGSSATTYAAASGKPIQATLTVKNNLSETLLSPSLVVKLSGSALDKNAVSPQAGVYNSSLVTVTWDQSNTANFQSLAPGEEKSFILNFSSLATLTGVINPEIDLASSLTGRPQSGTANMSASASSIVKITSEVALSSHSLYSRGPFKNTGPIPPKANTETTYTLDIVLGNTRNDIQDARVTGILGPNVKWTGEVSPGGEVTYDSATHAFTWNLGTLSSGAGFSTAAREAFIRVSLTPSLGQVGGAPVLVGNLSFTGTDSFSSTTIRTTNSALTTQISSDPMYVQGDEIVVK